MNFIEQWLHKRKIRKEKEKDLKLLKQLQNKLNGEVKTYSHIDEGFEIHGQLFWRDKYKKRLDELVKNKDKYLKTYNEEYVAKEIESAKKVYNESNDGCVDLQNKIDALRFSIWEDL